MLLENDKYGLTTQTLKIGQKRQKLLKHTENSLEKVYDQKAKQILFSTELAEKQPGRNWPKNNQYGQTARKTKDKSKTGKKHLKPLRNYFYNQRPKTMCFQKVSVPSSCQNAFNLSKLAHKRPKWSNSTKNKIRIKTSKTAANC